MDNGQYYLSFPFHFILKKQLFVLLFSDPEGEKELQPPRNPLSSPFNYGSEGNHRLNDAKMIPQQLRLCCR